MCGPGGRQTFSDLRAIHAVNPVEILGDRARFVALNRPDEMPLQIGVLQRRYFFKGFFHIILAECMLIASKRGVDCISAECFAHCKQCNCGRIAATSARRVVDALPHGLQVISDCGHNFADFEIASE